MSAEPIIVKRPAGHELAALLNERVAAGGRLLAAWMHGHQNGAQAARLWSWIAELDRRLDGFPEYYNDALLLEIVIPGEEAWRHEPGDDIGLRLRCTWCRHDIAAGLDETVVLPGSPTALARWTTPRIPAQRASR